MPYSVDITMPYPNDIRIPYPNDIRIPYPNDIRIPYPNDIRIPYPNLNSPICKFGQFLSNLDGIVRKRTKIGTAYLVKPSHR